MEPIINPDSSVYRILDFEEVYPGRAAEEQAEKSKLAAFGTLARLNPLNRPKADTVRLSKWELRYEPFWHLVARREVDYLHEAVYPVQITNPHARNVEIAGSAFEILPGSGGKPRIDVQLQEFCHRKIDVIIHQDGLKRGIKPAKLQSYIERYKAAERGQLDVEGTIPPQLPFNAAVQIVKAKLAAETAKMEATARQSTIAVDGYRAGAAAAEAQAGAYMRRWVADIKQYEAGKELTFRVAKANTDAVAHAQDMKMEAAKISLATATQSVASAWAMVSASADVGSRMSYQYQM